MLQRLFSAAMFLLVGLALSASVPAVASNPDAPAPFTLQGSPRNLGGGIQQAWRVKVDEDRAVQAIFKGGMWLPNGAGGRTYARYSSHILHSDGDWTWIGMVATAHGEQSVVITFGKDAVFGLIPQSNGYPLRLETEHGVVSLVRTSGAAISQSPTAVAMRATSDARAIPRRRGASDVPAKPSEAQAQQATAAAATPVIDVMVAFTPGIVSEYGSTSAALTRINNLVSIANQAYVASQVNQRIRLVNTVEVNYPDNTSNDSALDDITGYDSNGNPVTIPASLSQIHSLRVKYGADLVSLLREYDNATNGGCGLSWIVGGNLQPIVPSQDNTYGYSVVGDGNDAGYYCLDTSFAHELGHNMGDAHDRANADQPGAYPYSYGYKTPSPSGGFSTIMAYGDAPEQPLAVFSNPNISTCLNTPCGVPDNSSSSADNAHSMNNTAALIAQFEPQVVGSGEARNDIDGDGKSDLIWENPNAQLFGYWLMSGGTRLSYNSMSDAGLGYTLVAVGDLNGDGRADAVWVGAGRVVVWMNHGGGSFTSTYIADFPAGWQLFGTGDINDDGKADLLWENASSRLFGYWLMNGNTRLGYTSMPDAGAGYLPVAVSDFNGDGAADIVWTSLKHDVVMWLNNGSGLFTSNYVASYPNGWQIVGGGDIDGDGNADLLWENPGSNLFGYWLMSGAKRLSYPSVSGPGSGYTIVAFGDYDGSGRTDITWTSPSNGIYVWINNGNNQFTSNYIANYPSGWSLVPMISQ